MGPPQAYTSSNGEYVDPVVLLSSENSKGLSGDAFLSYDLFVRERPSGAVAALPPF